MNAIDLLKHDHREVERLFTEFLEAEDSGAEQREEIFQQIEKELLVHGDIEEQLLYPAVEDFIPNEVEEAVREHQEVRNTLGDLLEIEIDDEEFERTLMKLMERVQNHVQEEEGPGGILEVARQRLPNSRLQSMAKLMLEIRDEAEGEIAA
jgi:hemerythrin superfamily protein